MKLENEESVNICRNNDGSYFIRVGTYGLMVHSRERAIEHTKGVVERIINQLEKKRIR